MNIGIGKFIRDGFTLASVEQAFRRLVAAIVGGWEVQHKEDGTHTDVTCDTLTIGAVETDGNWTGSLIPTTSTQDVGGTITKAGSVSLDRPIRNFRLSGSIAWGVYGDTLTAGPGITYSGGTWAFDAGAGTNITITGRSGVNVTTLTVDGVNGATSSKNVTATTFVSAGSFVFATTYLGVTDGITAPGATAGQAKIYVDTADGDLKVVFGDGTVKTIVTDT